MDNRSNSCVGCIDPSISYYWWTCYDAAEEANPWFNSDWKDYGWRTGNGTSYTKSAEPGLFSGMGFFDPYHIAMNAAFSYSFCGKDGVRHAVYTRAVNELIFTWNKKTKSWTGPSSNN